MLKRYGSHLAAGLFFHDEHLSPKIGKVMQSPTFWKSTCAIVKTWYMGYGHPSYIGNHYNILNIIKPYWWVYDHPLLWENRPCSTGGTSPCPITAAGCRPCAGRSARWSSTPWGLVPGAANTYLHSAWRQWQPVPWSHGPNCPKALQNIGENPENDEDETDEDSDGKT